MKLTSAITSSTLDRRDVILSRDVFHAVLVASYLPALGTVLRPARPRFPGQALVVAGSVLWCAAELGDWLRLPALSDGAVTVPLVVQPGLSLLLAGMLRLAGRPLTTAQVTLMGSPSMAGWVPLFVTSLGFVTPDSYGYALGNLVATMVCLAVLLGNLRVAVPGGQELATRWVAFGILLHVGPDVLYPLVMKLHETERAPGGLWDQVIVARLAHNLAGTYCLTRGVMGPRG